MDNRLKCIRESLGLTQREAAKRLGVSQAAWCRWETGKRKLTDEGLVALSEALSRPVGEILGTGTDGTSCTAPEGSLDALAAGLDEKGRDALAATVTAFMGLPREMRSEAADAVRALARGEP